MNSNGERGAAGAWRRRFSGPWTGGLACLILTLLAVGALVTAVATPTPVAAQEGEQNIGQQLDQVSRDLQKAKKLDAHKQLPHGYKSVVEGLAEAEELLAAEKGTSALLERLASDLNVQVAWLLSRARFVHDIREQKNSWEAALGRFDHSLEEIALTMDVPFPQTVSGPAAATLLRDALSDRKMHVQLLVDSLTVANQNYERWFKTQSAEQESSVTALQVEISALRRQLWDTELRAGMAEASRSAAEMDLNNRRDREEAIREIGEDFGPDAAEVLLTPEGDVIIRVYGFSFAVGSAALNQAQEPLLEKLVSAVSRFPEAGLRIEGHTDDTGGRDTNLRLSRRRAETVANWLLERLEVTPTNVETVGHGPDYPLATNSTAEGRARNRRIDVTILAGGL